MGGGDDRVDYRRLYKPVTARNNPSVLFVLFYFIFYLGPAADPLTRSSVCSAHMLYTLGHLPLSIRSERPHYLKKAGAQRFHPASDVISETRRSPRDLATYLVVMALQRSRSHAGRLAELNMVSKLPRYWLTSRVQRHRRSDRFVIFMCRK